MMIMIINFSSSQLSPRLNNCFPYRWVRSERLLKSPSGRLFNLLFDRRLIGMTRQKKMRIYKVCHLKFLVKIHKDRERCFSSFHEHGIKKKKDGTDACHMSFVIDHAHRRFFVAQWLSGAASECGIRRSEVRFLMGTQKFFFVLRLWRDEKHLSLFLYWSQTYHLSYSIYHTKRCRLPEPTKEQYVVIYMQCFVLWYREYSRLTSFI